MTIPADSIPVGDSTTNLPAGSIPAGERDMIELAGATGLMPATTYHYRLDYIVGGFTIKGYDQAITTSSNAPPPTAPVITAFALSPSSFKAANSGPPTTAAAVGTRVTFKLNEPASVSFNVEQSLPGVRKGKNCVAAPKHRKGHPKRCTRAGTTLGGFTLSGPARAGANSFHFMGRLIGGQSHNGQFLFDSLNPGQYLLSAIATASGLNSKWVTHPFKIVR
jgi:hypothetical protein